MYTDTNLEVDEWVDFEVELPNDSNDATACRYVRPNTRVSASLLEQGQGRSGSEVKDGRPPPRTTHDLEMLNQSDLGINLVSGAGHLDSKFGQFGFSGRSSMKGTQSSPAVKLAQQTLQRQSSEDAATMDSSPDPPSCTKLLTPRT